MAGKNVTIRLEEIIPGLKNDLRTTMLYFNKILEYTNFPSYVIPDVTSKYLVGLDPLKKKMYRESLFSHIKVQEQKLYNVRELQYDEVIEVITRELQTRDQFYAYEPNINLSISVENNQFYLVWNAHRTNIKYADFNSIRMNLSNERLFELKVFDNYRRTISHAPVFGFYVRAPIFKLRSVLKQFYFHIIEFNYVLTSKSLPKALHTDNRMSDLYYNRINFSEMNNYPPRILEKRSVQNAVQNIMHIVEQNSLDLAQANIVVVSDTKYHRPFEGLFASSVDFNQGNYLFITFDVEQNGWYLRIVFPSDSKDLFVPFTSFTKQLTKWLL